MTTADIEQIHEESYRQGRAELERVEEKLAVAYTTP
jgi:hypothetical protein